MNKKTLIIIAAALGGSCCISGVVGALILAAGEDEKPAPSSPAAGAGAPSGAAAIAPTGYRIYGEVKVVAEGVAGSLAGEWVFIDGATSETIDSVNAGSITYHSNRSGELWHFKLDDDGSYAFKRIVSASGFSTADYEEGSWSSDGASLSLSPDKCNADTTQPIDCNPYRFVLRTVQLTELTVNDNRPDNQLKRWPAIQLDGTLLKFHGDNGARLVVLQRVR